jgi:hypothetical protein
VIKEESATCMIFNPKLCARPAVAAENKSKRVASSGGMW